MVPLRRPNRPNQESSHDTHTQNVQELLLSVENQLQESELGTVLKQLDRQHGPEELATVLKNISQKIDQYGRDTCVKMYTDITKQIILGNIEYTTLNQEIKSFLENFYYALELLQRDGANNWKDTYSFIDQQTQELVIGTYGPMITQMYATAAQEYENQYKKKVTEKTKNKVLEQLYTRLTWKLAGYKMRTLTSQVMVKDFNLRMSQELVGYIAQLNTQ